MMAALNHPIAVDDSRPDLPTGFLGLARRAWQARWPSAAISHHAKLIYFPVPKAANTAILTALTEIEIRAGRPPHYKDPRTGVPSHLEWVRPAGATAWARLFGFHRGYTVFTVVRNPWHRLVSCYLDKIRDVVGGSRRNDVYDAFTRYNRILRGRIFHRDMTFDQFARTVCWIPDFAADPHFVSQYRRFTSPRGHLITETIIPLEEPEMVRAILGRHLGDQTIAQVRTTPSANWRDYYDGDLAARVRRRYWHDVWMYGYGAAWWGDPSDKRKG